MESGGAGAGAGRLRGKACVRGGRRAVACPARDDRGERCPAAFRISGISFAGERRLAAGRRRDGQRPLRELPERPVGSGLDGRDSDQGFGRRAVSRFPGRAAAAGPMSGAGAGRLCRGGVARCGLGRSGLSERVHRPRRPDLLSEAVRRTRRGVARYGDFCRARRPASRLVSRFRARAVRRRGAFVRVVRSGCRHEQASGRLPGRHARRANVLPGRFRVSAAACRQRLRRGYSEPVQSDLSTESLYGPERRHGFAEVRAGFPVRSRSCRSVPTRSPFRNGFARDRRELPRRSRQAMAEVSCERP